MSDKQIIFCIEILPKFHYSLVILYPPFENSTTCIAISGQILFFGSRQFWNSKTPFLQVMGKNFMLITYGTVWDFSLPHWQLTSWSMDFCMTQAVSLEVRFLLGLDVRCFKISCQNDKRIIGIKFWSVWYQIIEVQLDSCVHGQLTFDDDFFFKNPW